MPPGALGRLRQAQVHVAQIEAAFGSMPLAAVRSSSVRSRTVKLEAAGLADSYVYALPSRLSQIMSDAVHDGSLGAKSTLAPHVAGCRRSPAVRRLDRAGVGVARCDR